MRGEKLVLFGLLAVTLLAAGAFTASARADFVNPGFEVPIVPGSQYQLITPSTIPAGFGWTVEGTDVLLINTTYGEPSSGITQFNSHSGVNALDVTGVGNTGAADGVYQDVATTAGSVYTLSFWIGRAGGTDTKYATAATVDMQIDNGPRTAYTNANLTAGSVNWQLFTTMFTASGASTRIHFLNGTVSPTSYAGVDDAHVSLASVPEPTSVALLGCGLSVASLVGWRRSRRQA
jgi:Protein of unknown function (DUF642)